MLKLQPENIHQTAVLLTKRIRERFPASGLGTVADEVVRLSSNALERSNWIAKPNYLLRAVVVFFVTLLLSFLFYIVFPQIRVNTSPLSWHEYLSGIEAGLNDLVYIGLLVVFLWSVELRLKRKKVIQAIRQLRSVAHIIDMHQLTKDPERAIYRGTGTESSPPRPMTVEELARYLDYCSEMLSILSKVAVVYIQHFDDAVALDAVDDLEGLTSGLQRKVWQKIAILAQSNPQRPSLVRA